VTGRCRRRRRCRCKWLLCSVFSRTPAGPWGGVGEGEGSARAGPSLCGGGGGLRPFLFPHPSPPHFPCAWSSCPPPLPGWVRSRLAGGLPLPGEPLESCSSAGSENKQKERKNTPNPKTQIKQDSGQWRGRQANPAPRGLRPPSKPLSVIPSPGTSARVLPRERAPEAPHFRSPFPGRVCGSLRGGPALGPLLPPARAHGSPGALY
jgi:hypothetical protein